MTRSAEIDVVAWRLFLSDYLRPQRPSVVDCYRRVRDCHAAPRGLALPSISSFRRRLAREMASQEKAHVMEAFRRGRGGDGVRPRHADHPCNGDVAVSAAPNRWAARVVIDDPDNGGSDPGAWATHIAHTPKLKAQVDRAARTVAAAGGRP